MKSWRIRFKRWEVWSITIVSQFLSISQSNAVICYFTMFIDYSIEPYPKYSLILEHITKLINKVPCELMNFKSFGIWGSLNKIYYLFLCSSHLPFTGKDRPPHTFSSIPIELTCWSDSVDQLLELPAPTPDAHSLQMPRPSAQWGRPTSSVGMPTRRPRPARANWGLEAAS